MAGGEAIGFNNSVFLAEREATHFSPILLCAGQKSPTKTKTIQDWKKINHKHNNVCFKE
jgi:hypothetical protein